jgi:2Fe-2S ferredoxin
MHAKGESAVIIHIRSEAEGDRTITGSVGESLMRTIRDAGFSGVEAECGGCLICGTCAVMVDDDWCERVGAPGEVEGELIDYGANPGPRTRLSCQMVLRDEWDGLCVTIPPTQR